MRLRLAILLLVLLPLQAVWAAAAQYCGHEPEPVAVVHFGHHEHEHQDIVVTGDAGSLLPDAGHADCHVCHATATISGLPGVGGAGAFLPEHPALSQVPGLPSPPVPRPERPNWSRLA